MYRKLVIVLAFLGSLYFPAYSLAGQFNVPRVYDGDTIKAKGHDIETKVRLVGIDAPETSKKKRDSGQLYGQQSKKYISALILKGM